MTCARYCHSLFAMCPLYPFHLVLLYLCLLLPLLLAVVEGSEELMATWRLSFLPRKLGKITEGEDRVVRLLCEDCADPADATAWLPGLKLALMSDDPRVASVEHEMGEVEDSTLVIDVDRLRDEGVVNGSSWTVPFRVRANFLGYADVSAEIRTEAVAASSQQKVRSERPLEVTAIRYKTLESRIFTYSVATLIPLAYINMGCALDLKVRVSLQ